MESSLAAFREQPVLHSPSLPARSAPLSVPLASGVIASRVDGTFGGWDGGTIVEPANGRIRQQSFHHFEYCCLNMPEVTLHPSGGGFGMRVAGSGKAVSVKRIR